MHDCGHLEIGVLIKKAENILTQCTVLAGRVKGNILEPIIIGMKSVVTILVLAVWMSVFVVWSLFFLAVGFEKIYGIKTEKFPLLYFAA